MHWTASGEAHPAPRLVPRRARLRVSQAAAEPRRSMDDVLFKLALRSAQRHDNDKHDQHAQSSKLHWGEGERRSGGRRGDVGADAVSARLGSSSGRAAVGT